MKKINWFLIIISVLSLFVVSFISVSAQEINIDDMDDAELLALLQVIMEKLEKDVSAGQDAAESVVTDGTVSVAGIDPDPIHFEIYENKKITVEPLPSYMFIRKPTGEDIESSPERDKIRDILQIVFENDYQGVQSMLGYGSVDDLYNDWKDSDTNWDDYGNAVNDWLKKH